MNINGRDITTQDLLDKLDELSTTWYSMMYTVIMDDPADWYRWPGSKYKKRKVLNEMITHFTDTEEYEKCAKLVKLKEW
jgi:hypothetical protein